MDVLIKNGLAPLYHAETGAAIVLELFVIVLAAGLVSSLVAWALRRLYRRLEQTRTPWDDALVDAARTPLHALVWLLGITLAARVFEHRLEDPAPFFAIVTPMRTVGVIAIIAWFLMRFISRFEQNFIHQRTRQNRPIDIATADAVSKLVRLSVIITTVLVALQTFGFDISGLLAFGGVGGVVVGIAAKDLLANFFGGLTIYLDRPFTIGEWIRSPDQNIEGTVEKIGWRRTLIRTFDQRPLYVPNAIFNNISVENPSRMLNRRIYETIGIRYDDADCMAPILADVRSMLAHHPDIDTDRLLMVNFNTFGASSLEFFVYTFTKTIVWAEYHRVKEDVLLKIHEIITTHGAEVAFPTSTLHIPEGLRMLDAGAGTHARQHPQKGAVL